MSLQHHHIKLATYTYKTYSAVLRNKFPTKYIFTISIVKFNRLTPSCNYDMTVIHGSFIPSSISIGSAIFASLSHVDAPPTHTQTKSVAICHIYAWPAGDGA